MLYILAGASGCGKKFVIDRMKRLCVSLSEVPKFTNKQLPSNESVRKRDLIYGVSKQEIIERCTADFCYQYHEKDSDYDNDPWYGVDIKSIDKELIYGCNPVVIVRDFKVIANLKKRYPFAVVLYIYTAITGDELTERLNELEIKDDKTPEERLKREVFDYTKLCEFLHETNFNIIDESIGNSFDQMLDKDIQNFLQRIEKIDYTRIFLAMPFNVRPLNNNIDEVYYPIFLVNTIKDVVNDINIKINRIYPKRIINGREQQASMVRIMRADDIEPGYYATYPIYERMLMLIKNSYLMITDLSLNNPNVSYEYGEACLLKKEIISIAKDGSFGCEHKDELNIDIIYSDPDDFIAKLTQKLCEYYHLEEAL